MTGKGGSSIDSFRWFFVIFPCLKSSLRDERKQSKNNLPKKKHMQLWVLTPILKIDISHTNCICREIWDFRKLFKCSAEGFLSHIAHFYFYLAEKMPKFKHSNATFWVIFKQCGPTLKLLRWNATTESIFCLCWSRNQIIKKSQK